jgi:hypothetical protein
VTIGSVVCTSFGGSISVIDDNVRLGEGSMTPVLTGVVITRGDPLGTVFGDAGRSFVLIDDELPLRDTGGGDGLDLGECSFDGRSLGGVLGILNTRGATWSNSFFVSESSSATRCSFSDTTLEVEPNSLLSIALISSNAFRFISGDAFGLCVYAVRILKTNILF